MNKNLPIGLANIQFIVPQISASPPRFFETTLGVDHERDRIEIIKKWIFGAIEAGTPQVRANTKVLLVPVTGGSSQPDMMKDYPLTYNFVSLEDAKLVQAIQFMIDEHDRHSRVLQSDDIYRYENTRMGPTSPGQILRPVFDAVKADMRALYDVGQLNFGEYEFAYLSDGKVTPLKDHFRKTLETFHQCSSCAANHQNCTGVCSLLARKMVDAWGEPVNNEDSQIDFNLGLFQSLPFYFGAGFMRINLVQLKKDRFTALNPGATSLFDRLLPLSEARALRFPCGKPQTLNLHFIPWAHKKAGSPLK